MPSAYTAMIKDGISFETFALRCARNFLFALREEPLNSEIPDEITPFDYHFQVLAEAEKNLTQIQAMSESDAERAMKEEHKKDIEWHEKQNEKKKELEKAYGAMMEKVKRWQAPTENHIQLKQFMLSQIQLSIEGDCSPFLLPRLSCSPTEWLADKISRYQKSIAYYKEEHEKEKSRCAKSTEWIRDLKKSLKVKGKK